MLITALLLIHLIAGSFIHLTEDEAYYRLWAVSPRIGYFDHPPMIAWWIWLGRLFGGDTPLGVRLLPILASAATTYLIFDSVRLVGAGDRVAFRAALWLNASILVAVGAFLAIPDAPASFFWTLAVWCALNAMHTGRPVWWIAMGAAAGLAALSKYSSLFIAPGLLLMLVCTSDGRRWLKTPWPWMAIPVAMALFALNVAWNAEHGWVTFIKQFGRVQPTRLTSKYIVEFVGAQVFLLNPLVAVFVGWAAIKAQTAPARISARAFLALAAPFILYLILHSFHDRVQAHWPAPLYPALVVAAAMVAEAAAPGSPLQWIRRVAPVPGFLIGAIALVYLAAPIPSPFTAFDPADYVRDWPGFSRRVETVRVASGAQWIGTLSYGEAAQLAQQTELHAPVLQIDERERYAFAPTVADIRKPGLVLDLTRRMDPKKLSRCFVGVRPLGLLRRTIDKTDTYQVYVVTGPRQVVGGGCSMTTL